MKTAFNRTDNGFTKTVKIALPLSLLWFAGETIENSVIFYCFFPRRGVFRFIFDLTIVKFLLIPALKLFFFTILIYFLVSWCCALVSVAAAGRIWKNRKGKIKEFLFHLFNSYSFLYLVAGLNGFLHPRSYERHFFTFGFVFPQWAGPESTDYFNALHYFFAVYWLALVCVSLPCLFGIFKKAAYWGWRRKKHITIVIILTIVFFSFSRALLPEQKDKKFTQPDNIIFIVLDSFQYNQMAKEWGAMSEPAPDILEFMKKGTLFLDVWTPFARTFPSTIALLTGRYPFSNGVRANLLHPKHEDPGNLYLGDILKDQGYHRFYSIDDPRFSRIGRRHGFDEIFSPESRVSGFLLTSFCDYTLLNIMMHFDFCPWIFSSINNNRSSAAYNPRIFARNLINRLKQLPRDKKQFILMHLCTNHHPYTLAFPYTRDPEWPTCSEFCMRAVNDQFVMLMDYFKESGLYDNSLIVVFSDHGSGWNRRHYRLSHGSNVMRNIEAYKTVLSFYGKGFPKGRQINDRVRTIDIYPTVLELLGYEAETAIDGASVMPLVNGLGEESPRSVFAESGYSLAFYYKEPLFQQAKRLQTEFKNFMVDPETGQIFIKDNDYYEILERKWYFIVDREWRYVYNPWENEEYLIDMDQKMIIENETMQNEFKKKLDIALPGQRRTPEQ